MKYPLACSLLGLLLLNTALAASTGGREAFYRCRDASGQTFFGDRMPTECRDLDTEVLSDNGNVLRVIDGAASRAASAKSKSTEDATAKARFDAAMRDRMLVEAYLSVKEIEQLRDQRLALVEAQLHIDEQNLTALQEREQRLLRQATRFLPYNTKAGAAPLPEQLTEEMVTVVKSTDVSRQRIVAKQAEREELKAKFESDISRFKQLKGL
ncbi:MAG: DUF4124 domain-containing protein [Steroidobacteraceae bacterium]